MIAGLSPVMIVSIVAVAIAFTIALAIVAQRALRGQVAYHWYFDRQRGVTFKSGENHSGLITTPDGGYMEHAAAEIDMRFGRSFHEIGPVNWRRSRRPVFLVRAGDSAPIQIQADGSLLINNLDEETFQERAGLASDLAVADAQKRNGQNDFIAKAVALTALILGLGVIAIVVAIVARGT